MTSRFAALFGLSLVLFLGPAAGSANSLGPSSGIAQTFPIPDGLNNEIAFWTSIYATYGNDQVVMHDNRHLGVVYGVLDFRHLSSSLLPEKAIRRKVNDAVDEERKRIISILEQLDGYGDAIPFSKLTPEARSVYEAFRNVDEVDKYRAAARRVRGQRGQRNHFMEGIARVHFYMPRMEEIFRARGLPTDLTRLTFVESMFNLRAYSKVGAAGPWQFMSATGKRYLTIDSVIDERMDPIKSTEAAASLLYDNYRSLGNWGLALTAYNHGVTGMKRAVRMVGSDNIEHIVWAYESRSFGFASRNFYAEFLAARDVYNQRHRYFGAELANHPPIPLPTYEEIVLPDHVSLATFVEHCGVDPAEIKRLNPQLTRYVFHGQKYLPKQYPIKVPPGHSAGIVKSYRNVPSKLRYASQKRNEYHRVRRGETLARIARRYGMSVDALADLNTLSSRNRIYAGQRIRVLTPERVIVKSTVKEPKVKILPVVKLAEDQTHIEEEDEELPIPELPTEEQELLAAAEAPAMDAGAPPAAAGSIRPMAEVLGKGLISLFSVVVAEAAELDPEEELPAPRDRSVASIAPGSVPSEADGGDGGEELEASGSALDALRPHDVPRRGREVLRSGGTPAPYPGGVRCSLGAGR